MVQLSVFTIVFSREFIDSKNECTPKRYGDI